MVAVAATTEMAVSDRLLSAVSDLEPDSATMLRAAFESMFAQADEWLARARTIRVTSVDQKREMKFARESRLALRAIRVDAEKARKRLKEDSVRRGKAIDGIANVLKALIGPIEEHLLEQETFAERAEDARKTQLREARSAALRAYGVDPATYADLGASSEEAWGITIDTARVAHEAKLEAARQAEVVRVEAERIAAERRAAERAAAVKAEAERVARERAQAEENALLKREAEERGTAARIERERATTEKAALEAEMVAIEAKARVEREAAETEARAAKEAADRAEAELAAVREAGARSAREREAEEVKQATEAAERRRQAELAPDREKIAAFAAALRAIPIPTLSSDRGWLAAKRIGEEVEKLAARIETTGAKL